MQGKKIKPLEAEIAPTLDLENISPICKDAFNKVLSINQVHDLVGFVNGEMGNIVQRGSFTSHEVGEMRESYETFATDMNGILEAKFKNAGSTLDDCLKKAVKGTKSNERMYK